MNQFIYALGFFDGVHLGHQALLSACRQLGRETNIQWGVVTFASHPDTLVHRNTPGLINTAADRERLLRFFGGETVVKLPFDETMMHLPWRDFLDFLRRDYGAAGFVCGQDFRFGYRGEGNAQTLETYCRELRLPCATVPEQTLDDIRISSTHIRRLLEGGNVRDANRFLGHPHILTGEVIHGHQLGRRLGIPTANLGLPGELAVPKFGVYACGCTLDGRRYPAVTNIGVRPTVSGEGITVEPWILDYTGDLYGREITLEFYDFLRPEEKFPDLDSLKNAIHQNAQQARIIMNLLSL